jgi:hypothetical protein
MSILIRSTADWFRCIRSTVAEEHYAAFVKLGRLLAGAASYRRPPPVSLPGRPATPPPAPPALPPPVPLDSRPASWVPRGKAVAHPGKATDGDPPYSRAQLERMNTRFAERLEHAIAQGKERPHA